MSPQDVTVLREAIETIRRARHDAIERLAGANTAENRSAVAELNKTFSLLRSIQHEERGLMSNILKKLGLLN